MSLPCATLHGAGNGDIVIDGRAAARDWPALACAMAHAHTGVRSDGLIVVQHSVHAQVRMRVLNSDGSEAEMSGNGIRLLAKCVLDRDMTPPNPEGPKIETGGGIRTVWPTLVHGKMVAGKVAMGTPTFTADQIPVSAPNISPQGDVKEYPFEVAGRTLSLTCVAIGNPHAVAFPHELVESFPLADIGPVVERHLMFPHRINFEIVHIQDQGNMRVRVFERGEGETLSSGTCSTAAAIAARLYGYTTDQVCVHLPGGR